MRSQQSFRLSGPCHGLAWVVVVTEERGEMQGHLGGRRGREQVCTEKGICKFKP